MKTKLFNVLLALFLNTGSFAQITRAEITANAEGYVNYSWTANTSNLWNGTSCNGKNVYKATWVTGAGNYTSMPYCWGGWSTTSQHNSAMGSGKSAGDVCSAGGGGCSGGGAGISCASGHDCSGLVSRAWELGTKYGTTGIPDISTAYSSLSNVLPGDVTNLYGSHCRLVYEVYGNGNIKVIEASGVDWKCSYRTYSPIDFNGYSPRYYNNLLAGGLANDDCAGAVSLTSHENCVNTSSTVNGAAADNFPTPASCDAFGGTILGAGVFFKFTAVSSTHTITVDPSSSGASALDAVVVLYSGSNCFTLNEVGCEDAIGGGGVTTDLTVNNLVVGQQYWIRVYDYGSANTTSGNFSICVTHEPCEYSINPSSATLSPNAGSGSFSINTTTGCAWSASESCNWVTLTNSSGTGSGTISYTVTQNTGTERECIIDVEGEEYVITQEAASTPCSYSISPSIQNFSASGGNGSFSITTGTGCNWSASSNCGWVQTTSSGSGNGVVSFTVISNTGSPRTCTITVGGQSFTINQDGSTNCIYSLSPSSNTYTYTSTSGNFNVSVSHSSCSWSATESCSWVTLTNSSGTGNGTVTFNLDANTGSARTCDITVSGQTFTITQNGPPSNPPTASIGISQQNSPCPMSVDFIDNSTNTPTSWLWEFFGNCVSPSYSTQQNPDDVTYEQQGIYTVKLTATNSFGSGSTTSTVTVGGNCNCTSGINENNSNELSVFPNPSKGSFVISGNIKSSEYSDLRIYSSLGQLVFEKKLTINGEFSETILTDGLASGIYHMQFVADGKISYKKLIIER